MKLQSMLQQDGPLKLLITRPLGRMVIPGSHFSVPSTTPLPQTPAFWGVLVALVPGNWEEVAAARVPEDEDDWEAPVEKELEAETPAGEEEAETPPAPVEEADGAPPAVDEADGAPPVDEAEAPPAEAEAEVALPEADTEVALPEAEAETATEVLPEAEADARIERLADDELVKAIEKLTEVELDKASEKLAEVELVTLAWPETAMINPRAKTTKMINFNILLIHIILKKDFGNLKRMVI